MTRHAVEDSYNNCCRRDLRRQVVSCDAYGLTAMIEVAGALTETNSGSERAGRIVRSRLARQCATVSGGVCCGAWICCRRVGPSRSCLISMSGSCSCWNGARRICGRCAGLGASCMGGARLRGAGRSRSGLRGAAWDCAGLVAGLDGSSCGALLSGGSAMRQCGGITGGASGSSCSCVLIDRFRQRRRWIRCLSMLTS